ESPHHFVSARGVVIGALDILICRHMNFSLRADCLARINLADWVAPGNYLRGNGMSATLSGLGRGFTQADRYCLSAGMSFAGVPALNLSRRDKNRADLSSDK
ncbi:MAG TPA: hypothetical protein VLI44_03960, partial [Sporolactobacillaceae bacterium]|nr:hypothetical protein [Sporolactobacillaceae bacterium]